MFIFISYELIFRVFLSLILEKCFFPFLFSYWINFCRAIFHLICLILIITKHLLEFVILFVSILPDDVLFTMYLGFLWIFFTEFSPFSVSNLNFRCSSQDSKFSFEIHLNANWLSHKMCIKMSILIMRNIFKPEITFQKRNTLGFKKKECFYRFNDCIIIYCCYNMYIFSHVLSLFALVHFYIDKEQ